MFDFNTELAFLYAVFSFSLLSIFLTAWVVWHVEKKLDVSYKFFLLTIIVFGVGILFEIFQFYNVIAAWQWEKIFKGLFVIFFTVGVFEMRDLILDLKEKEKPQPPIFEPAAGKDQRQQRKTVKRKMLGNVKK
ncbi:MAG: hypothetical protein A3J62_03320 [Candidatus Buchananbacteria bacterium RIFCSPHIGHO2_02_FULL_38_8]|uniref:Uncharacterized protein n=2 Tax=Candidatus Buchananiibacteriota TaxID=1817903 RepID=A0A1G1XU29_9BACT|nr:MAG: hypothetical protein A2731_02335 [Candidatus Buchananbacteria bacterium RIFCSPHIGHO2_01_FULL_39_8]OGY47526.1 MAG: hypothetical protein A3J62_03320 [Candidatus Buchananbacteria bacterium RIFCSPHIGHO2_02_FULL_38_8]